MSIHAGSILHLGGNNVIDRIQSAGLGDARIPTEVIREVGNREVVDKVPGDPDFTFTLESLDVTDEIEAWLNGEVGTGLGSAAGPGAANPAGTGYDWLDCSMVNIPSPWKDPATGSAGVVNAGHLVPGYYPTRIRYRMGVTDNATVEVELGGGSYYYAEDAAPVEEFANGDGVDTTFPITDPAIGYRKGGAAGTTFRRIFGVIVDGELMIPNVDYTESGPVDASASAVTITFTTAPAAGTKNIRFCYFTNVAKSFPQTVHAATVVKPGAVRGRNICVKLGSGAVKVGNVQAFELEATVDGEIEREFCNEEPTGRTVNGHDCNGSITVRAKNKAAFFDLLERVTGVPGGEVIGFLNTNETPLIIEIQNPKTPATILKTLYVSDAIFSIPSTPARVNTPTDFQLQWESKRGSYIAYKGAKP
jgi:hypothetical protein